MSACICHGFEMSVLLIDNVPLATMSLFVAGFCTAVHQLFMQMFFLESP
jgi:hypothetical protein